jgi:O-antigen/teichoic acid export membrane protein
MPTTTQAELDNSTFKPALMLMSGRVLAFAATFFVPVLLARIFTPAELGTYKQFFLVVYMLYGIGQMGMAESLFYFLPSAREAGGRYVVNSMMVLAAGGVVLLAAFSLFSRQIAGWMSSNPELPHYIGMAGVYLLLMLTACALEIVWISRKRYRMATISYASSDVIRAILLIGPALLFRSLHAVIVGGLVFCAARVVAAILIVRREFPHELRPDAALLKKQLTYAIPFALAVVVDIAQANYHQLAVSRYFDAATFAVYAVGCLQIPLVDFMATPASNVMMVRMAEEIRDSRPQSVLSIWHDTTRKLALVFYPLVGLLVVNANAIITVLFTERYAASVPIFMVWSLSILLASIQTDSVMRVFAQTRFLFFVNLMRLAVLVTVMHLFLNRFHLLGAVFVTLLGSLFARSMALMRMRKLVHVSVIRLMPWSGMGRVLLIAMISSFPTLFLNAYVAAPPKILLILGGAAYAMTYTSLILAFRVLTSSERQAIFGWLARWKRCAE